MIPTRTRGCTRMGGAPSHEKTGDVQLMNSDSTTGGLAVNRSQLSEAARFYNISEQKEINNAG